MTKRRASEGKDGEATRGENTLIKSATNALVRP
jgi:hypothetical protein